MGVNGLMQWLRRHHPTAFVTPSSEIGASINFLAIDLLDIIYSAVRKLKSPHETFLFRDIFEELDALVKEFPNLQYLALALDGVSPTAKHAVQRERRLKQKSGVFDTLQRKAALQWQ